MSNKTGLSLNLKPNSKSEAGSASNPLRTVWWKEPYDGNTMTVTINRVEYVFQNTPELVLFCANNNYVIKGRVDSTLRPEPVVVDLEKETKRLEKKQKENDSPIQRLTADLKSGAKTLSPMEARFLVDAYYMMQDQRIRSGGQIRALSESEEPHDVLQWFLTQNETLENEVKKALTNFASANYVSSWAMSIKGIGPVISAGLLAHIDINKAPTVGHIWAYAGLDPTKKWEKKTKRPWNASLKVLCWKIGESFIKNSGRGSYYGMIYNERKLYEQKKNDAGEYATLAAEIVAGGKYKGETIAKAAYQKGRLPDGHIHARARRYAVKLFLSHLHEIWYKHAFGKDAPKPYAISILGHAHEQTPDAVIAYEKQYDDAKDEEKAA